MRARRITGGLRSWRTKDTDSGTWSNWNSAGSWRRPDILKGGSRVIALADYKAEKSFVLKVPHRVLLGDDELPPDLPAPKQARTARGKRPRGGPF